MALSARLRAAAEVVGVLARVHLIVAAGGYYSFVEAGRSRRPTGAASSQPSARWNLTRRRTFRSLRAVVVTTMTRNVATPT